MAEFAVMASEVQRPKGTKPAANASWHGHGRRFKAMGRIHAFTHESSSEALLQRAVDAGWPTLRLPSAIDMRAALRGDGFVLVRGCLDDSLGSTLAALALATIQRNGTRVVRSAGNDVLDYEVVTGDVIRSEAAPLFDFYRSTSLLTWLRTVSDLPGLDISPHTRSSININALRDVGQRYPWHTDAVPFTALLFLTTLPESSGGAFVLRSARGELVPVPPVKGDLVLMDGQRCPHGVAPLRSATARITVPMVYPAVAAERPAGLDGFLYDSTRTS